LAIGKTGGIPSHFRKRVTDDPNLVDELRGRRRPCPEETVSESDRAPQRGWVAGAEPDRRPGFLERLRLHGRAFQLPESPVEGDPWLRPERFHQPQPLGETSHQAAGIDAERGEHPESPSGADADLKASSTQLVQRTQALGQVNRAVERGDEQHAAQAQPLCAGGRVGHRLDWTEVRHRTENLFSRPGAAEAKRLGTRQVGTETGGVECAVGDELRDGDRESNAVHRWPCQVRPSSVTEASSVNPTRASTSPFSAAVKYDEMTGCSEVIMTIVLRVLSSPEPYRCTGRFGGPNWRKAALV